MFYSPVHGNLGRSPQPVLVIAAIARTTSATICVCGHEALRAEVPTRHALSIQPRTEKLPPQPTEGIETKACMFVTDQKL
jgi:hypothetical protein